MINILLESIDLFGRVNEVYGKYFGTSPAARACVGVNLPQGVRIRMECIAFKEIKPTDRYALHVQGLSYWAPANIGPYSQAISVSLFKSSVFVLSHLSCQIAEHIFISGQIGLIPSKLALPSPQSLPLELALSSQHVERVLNAVKDQYGGSWAGHEELVIYWLTDLHNISPTKIGHMELRVRQNVHWFMHGLTLHVLGLTGSNYLCCSSRTTKRCIGGKASCMSYWTVFGLGR